MKHSFYFHLVFSVAALMLFSTQLYASAWERVLLGGGYEGLPLYRVTSELDDPGPRALGPYGGHNLFDRKRSTCWAEGKAGPGIGEAILVEIPRNSRTIHIINGYAKRDDLFLKNNRVRNLKLSLYFGMFDPGMSTELFDAYNTVRSPQSVSVPLKDVIQPQRINFPFDWGELERYSAIVKNMYKGVINPDIPVEKREKYILKLEIESVYPGSKYNDTCISGIWFTD